MLSAIELKEIIYPILDEEFNMFIKPFTYKQVEHRASELIRDLKEQGYI